MLRIAARTIGSPTYTEMIEEMDRELTKVVEDFDRAVGAEALRLANESSRHSFLNLSLVEPHSLVQSEQSESESNESEWSKSE